MREETEVRENPEKRQEIDSENNLILFHFKLYSMRGVGRFILAILVIFFVILSIVMSIYADLFWFLKLGYENVFLTILFTRLGLWFVFFKRKG